MLRLCIIGRCRLANSFFFNLHQSVQDAMVFKLLLVVLLMREPLICPRRFTAFRPWV